MVAFPQVDYCNRSLYESWRDVLPDGPPESVVEMYRNIVDRCQPAIGQVLCAAASGPFPLLIHCKIVKDRTGIIVALLLSALGVPPETIVADYAESASNLEPLVPELLAAAAQDGLNLERYARLLQSPPAAMTGLLAHLTERYGSVSAYLDECGFTAPLRQQLQEKWLVGGAQGAVDSQQ